MTSETICYNKDSTVTVNGISDRVFIMVPSALIGKCIYIKLHFLSYFHSE